MKKLDLKIFDVVELTNGNKAIIKKIDQEEYLVQEFEKNDNTNFRMIMENEIKKIIYTRNRE